MKAFEALMNSHNAAIQNAQTELDSQQLVLIDKINMYDARGASTLSMDEMFDWFLTEKANDLVRRARRTGYAEVDYVPLEDMPDFLSHLEVTESATVLESLEPNRRCRKMLGHQAIDGALGIISFGKTLSVGNPIVPMLEYEMDADNYAARSGDDRLYALTGFVQDWDQFLISQGQPPLDA